MEHAPAAPAPRPSLPAPIRKILVPTDFSASSERALDYAMDLARALGAEIHLCHVGPLPDYEVPVLVSPGMQAAAKSLVDHLAALFQATRHEMDELRERKKGQGVELSDSFVEGYPDDGIVTRAKEWGAHLIVMGSHGRRGLTRVLLGSVAERVIRAAPCPVLVVH